MQGPGTSRETESLDEDSPWRAVRLPAWIFPKRQGEPLVIWLRNDLHLPNRQNFPTGSPPVDIAIVVIATLMFIKEVVLAIAWLIAGSIKGLGLASDDWFGG
jgi:hypothetical protein